MTQNKTLTDNEAFEKWYGSNTKWYPLTKTINHPAIADGEYLYDSTRNFWRCWQAAKQETAKEIAELKEKIEIYASNANHALEIYAKDDETITRLKVRALEESNKYIAYCDLAEKTITELQSQVNQLREALIVLEEKSNMPHVARCALASIPVQLL